MTLRATDQMAEPRTSHYDEAVIALSAAMKAWQEMNWEACQALASVGTVHAILSLRDQEQLKIRQAVESLL
jgi:hypothetical protein